MHAEPFVSIARASRETGISAWILRKLIVSGLVPSIRLGGRRRVRISQVEAAIEAASKQTV